MDRDPIAPTTPNRAALEGWTIDLVVLSVISLNVSVLVSEGGRVSCLQEYLLHVISPTSDDDDDDDDKCLLHRRDLAGRTSLLLLLQVEGCEGEALSEGMRRTSQVGSLRCPKLAGTEHEGGTTKPSLHRKNEGRWQ